MTNIVENKEPLKKINESQIYALLLLREQKVLPYPTAQVHTNTLNALIKKNLIVVSRYVNGYFAEITDLGLSTVVYHRNNKVTPFSK